MEAKGPARLECLPPVVVIRCGPLPTAGASGGGGGGGSGGGGWGCIMSRHENGWAARQTIGGAAELRQCNALVNPAVGMQHTQLGTHPW